MNQKEASMRRRSRSAFHRILFRLLAVVLSLLLVVLVGEILVRVFVPKSYWQSRDATDDWEPHPRLGWVQKPNLDVTTRNGSTTVQFQTNLDGLQPVSARREKQPATVRIVIFGDSIVAGRSVPQDQTVHVHLENVLRAAGIRAEVINAGVQGYSTDQALIRMEELVPLYSPDIVLYGLCDNDFGGNMSRWAYGLAKPSFALAEDGSLTELAPPELNEHISRFGGGIRTWVQYSALYRVLQPGISILRARLSGQEAQDLTLGLPAECYCRPERWDGIDWKHFGALIARMKACCGKSGTQFVFYAHPSPSEVWDPYIEQSVRRLGVEPERYDRYALEKHLRRIAVETATDYCPLVGYFAQRQDRGPFHLLPHDPHCNGAGYQLTAEGLVGHLLNEGAYLRSNK